MTDTAEAVKTAKSNSRPYRVFHWVQASLEAPEATHQLLQELGTYTAGSARSAMAQALKDHGPGHFVAVAKSQFHEHSAAVENVNVVRWS